MNTRKLFTDPTEEHSACSSPESEEKTNTKTESDCDSQRPTGSAEEYLGEKL